MNKLERECKSEPEDGSVQPKEWVYNVEVMYLENYDELADKQVYVEVFGYGADDNELKAEKTKVITIREGSEWDEKFEFDGPYDSFVFKLYGDEEYLGETREIKVPEIDDCVDEFEFRLEVTNDGKGRGLLVVIISKDGCDEEVNEKGNGGGKGKNKK